MVPQLHFPVVMESLSQSAFTVVLNRGVHLSPKLFNPVVEELLDTLQDSYGYFYAVWAINFWLLQVTLPGI